MEPVVVENEAELVALFRARIVELNTTFEAVGAYAGLGDSMVAKLLSPSRIRRFGTKSLPLLLHALALGIARVEFIEDQTRAVKARKRLTPRRRRVSPQLCIAEDFKQDDLFCSKTEDRPDGDHGQATDRRTGRARIQGTS